jgi:tRNA pseudouridine38-40 synthase
MQPDRITVQSTLETAITKIVQEPVRIVGSGRTDAKAHAALQVVAFSTVTRLECKTLAHAVNAVLPGDIAVTAASDVDPEFDPRRDATSRTYRYLIWNRPVRSPFMMERALQVGHHLDEHAMHLAAQRLLGRHDLSAFVPKRTEGTRERTVFAASCSREGHIVAIDLEATGFMRQMARAIAGTLVRVGAGKLTPDDFATILRARDRAGAGDTAPACGLYLMRVKYPGANFQTTDDRLAGYAWLPQETAGVCEETT